MSKYFYIIIGGLIYLGYAQYTPQSPYLQNPDKAVGYVDSCATFWIHAYDSAQGGFYTNIDKFGNVITAWGTNKNMLTQTRDAYGFVRAYMLTGNENYLHLAREGLNFMYQYAWDQTYGGWYSEISESGTVLNPTADKSAFDQHYALLGVAAYYEATGDTTDLHWLWQGYQHMENWLWDNRPQYFGYYDYGSFNWLNVSDKSFNATVDAITTHLLYLYLLTEEQVYKDRLLDIAENIITHLVGSMPMQAIGFAEKFDSDWNINNGETMTIMGHVLKAAWCLGRLYQLEPDTSFTHNAALLIEEVWTKGYDHEFGGPYKDYNRLTGQMLMWGNPDTAKAWWQMEQAVTAGLEMYQITSEDQYLQMADETLDFFMKYFVDHEYGEVYENRTRYGAATWGENKGNGYKAGYHSIELGYYVYLYGKLFVQNQPVILHYYFEPMNEVRVINLSPLAILDQALVISDMTLDGLTYSNYDPISRELYLDPGIGGHFTITFESVPVTIVQTGEELTPKLFTLYPNYPNPFNSITKIRFDITKTADLELFIYNLNGQKIKTLFSGITAPGTYQLQWDGTNQFNRPVASGMYFYEVQAGEIRKTERMLLLK